MLLEGILNAIGRYSQVLGSIVLPSQLPEENCWHAKTKGPQIYIIDK